MPRPRTGSVETWTNSSQQAELFEQLKKHNKTINDFTNTAKNRKVAGKVLLVTERGFTRLPEINRNIIEAKVRRFGWVIEVIPGEHLESMGQFIERMRKGS